MSRRSRFLILTAALALAVPTVATASPRSPDEHSFDSSGDRGPISATVQPRSLAGNAKVNVIVQLEGDPVAVAEAKADRKFSKSERAGVKRKLSRAQAAIGDDIRARGGRVLSSMQSAYNGMRVQIARNKAASLARLPGVVGVHAVATRRIENEVSVPYLGVPQVWQDTGFTGEGVKVAIIDTGIDYTHADFGGPGTTDAFNAAAATSDQPADPALFGPAAPRVKGGYDFVGDDYDAGADAGTPPTLPQPDPNPLDCNGHGTHVAGTTGGGGVTADGQAYSGPYDAGTHATDFEVGPGVAPKVDLYALRVFGCDGSTDVVVEAIDWAVEHDMDVINMSLGSPYGSADDPDSVAATNAVGAGVVVVTSAGNSGPNPYLTGSPGVGQGVIATAAVDSVAEFPGALFEVDGEQVSAINANGADLPSGSHEIVVVTDDPGTTENEALGCSAQAFTKAGVQSGAGAPAQLAVVQRGTCARVAKAIFGQQAGADVVVMVNNADTYPPYEGPITSNPDDGTPYTVTIPLLGVRSSDGPVLAGADGESTTLSPTELENPGYGGFASFSSGGPASGDSGLSPNIAAPGVSIMSAGVGTGNGPAINSGTSMAAPHVAGVAALAVQAHPGWRAQDVAAALASTADPENIEGYTVTLGGGGLVDTAQAVGTSVFATGDRYRTASGSGAETSLSFGFAEPSFAYIGTRTLTIHNRGSRAVTYTVGSEAAADSRPGKLRFSTRKVKVPARGTARVKVTLTVRARDVGSSLGGDHFAFRQVSGNVVLSGSAGRLRVPYLLVPRAQAHVEAALSRARGWTTSLSAQAPQPAKPLTVKLTNRFSALDADAELFTWGLTDARDVPTAIGGSGFDLRAAGVNSYDISDGRLVVFAVNNHDRWSNAAAQEFDVLVDTDADGEPDFIVFSVDGGLVTAGSANGVSQVFVYDLATGGLGASGFLAQAPTDSSTILLPVYAEDLGLEEGSDPFRYTVESYSLVDDAGYDAMPGWASYQPWSKAIADGDYVTVRRNRKVQVPLAVDLASFAQQKPLGVMVVVLDNRSGAREAQLLRIR